MFRAMFVSETSRGTPVVEMTAEEYKAFLEREVRAAMGLSVEEFRRAYLAGELDEADPSVCDLAGLLRVGQGGYDA